MKRTKYFFIALIALIFLVCLSSAASATQPTVFHSPIYGVNWEAGLIGQIPGGTDEQAFLRNILTNSQLSLSDGVKTGSSLVITEENAEPQTLELVVQADCSGDGDFSITDMLMVKSSLLGMQEFTPSQTAAADVSGDGDVTITDFLQMKSQLLELSEFSLQPLSALPDCKVLPLGQTLSVSGTAESISLLGSAVSWQEDRLVAVQEGVAQIQRTEGDTLLVLVTPQPQGVVLPESIVVKPMGTAQVQPRLTYPVKTPLRYQSSDEAIFTVDENGLITAVAEGAAALTVTPENGTAAEVSVRVLPLVESITLSAESMKIKNGKTKILTATALPEEAQEPLIWSSSDTSIATVDENGVITGVKNGYVTITCTAEFSGVSASCQVKVCDLIQIAITFDDGPSSAYTDKVLDMLEKYDIPATFFMVGYRLSGCKDTVIRMAEEGHELGYHTWKHDFFADSSASQISSEYKRFQDRLMEYCGRTATVFRSPGGRVTTDAYNNIPLPHIYWTIDTRDWETRNTEAVKKAIIGGLKDGAIILLHDIHGTTYTGTLAALEYIFENDLDVEFLTVTELLSRNGTPPTAGRTYYRG